jgi:hypothetical protein
MKIFGGGGNLAGTATAVVYATATVQLLFIPIVGCVSYFTTNTQVTMTYPYIISYGYGGDDGPIGWFDVSSRIFKYRESYIREKEPQREQTVLIPIEKLEPPSEIGGLPDYPPQQRISADNSPYEKPLKSLKATIRPGFENLWLAIEATDFCTMYFYFAATLSAVHKKNPILLFSLAVIVPPLVFGFMQWL